MSDRYGTDYPEDEPVIGATYAPPPPPRQPDEPQHYIGGAPAYSPPEPAGIGFAASEFAEDDEYYDEDDEYGYYDEDEYYEDTPARQPMFYVFVGLAALVGGIVVFLLFSLVNNGGDNGSTGDGDTRFAVAIDSPPKDKRIEIGKVEDVIVQASATEAIVRFELFVGDRLTDTIEVTETPADNKYRAVLRLSLTQKGNFDIFVKVTASSGATKESAKVRVIAIEPVGERPQTISGVVIADTTLRAGPGETFAEAGSLRSGENVTILGKDRAIDWLLIETAQGSRWARRTAIEPRDSLDLVPFRDVTPTPAPTATNTAIPSVSPSPSASPSPSPDSPDFVPTNATLIDGGTILRVTVQNISNNAYNGPLVVGVGGGDVPTAERVATVQMAANGGSASFDFDVNPPINVQGKKAVVTVDPANALKELREDNNGATFVLLPPEESPEIVIQAPTVLPGTISVTIQNNGGALAATSVVVRVKLDDQITQSQRTVALANGQTADFSVARPTGSGQATAEVVIGNQVVASAPFEIGP